MPFSKAKSTKSTASSRFIRKRVISGLVMVTGFPALICSIKRGMTDPLEHITLPYLVQQMTVSPLSAATRAFAATTCSIIAFEMPIALIGYAALSVERQTIFLTPSSMAACRRLSVPSTLVRTASIGKNSQLGTCLSAAAWKI